MQESLDIIEELKVTRDESFHKHFVENTLPNLGKLSKWAIESLTKFDPYCGIPQNQPESLNRLLKCLNK